MTLRCTICANPTARRMIDARLDDKATAAAISRELEGIGATVTAEVISRHRKHYADGRPLAPKNTRKRDLALLVRDKVMDRVENASGDELEGMLFSKEGQGAISVGLRAEKIIDERARETAKTGRTLELVSALLGLVGIGPMPEAPAIEDGNTIEGTAVEVYGEAE